MTVSKTKTAAKVKPALKGVPFKKFFGYFPVVLIAAVIIYWLYFKFYRFPAFEDLSIVENVNQSSLELAVEQITNANEFLISLLTALFGLCGFFLNKHKTQLRFLPLAIVYFLCLILLGLAYYSAFNVYASLINSLAQNTIALTPGASSCLYYIEEEFVLAGGTSVVLLSILIVIFINSTKIELS